MCVVIPIYIYVVMCIYIITYIIQNNPRNICFKQQITSAWTHLEWREPVSAFAGGSKSWTVFFWRPISKSWDTLTCWEKKVCWQWLRRENQENLAAQDSACGTSSVSSITGTTLFLRTGRLTRGCSSQWRCHHYSSLLKAMQRSENSTVDHQLKCWWFLTRRTNLFEGGKTANLETFQLPIFPASFAIGSTRLCLPGRSAKPGKSLSPPSQMMSLVIFRADHHLIHSNPIPPIFNTLSQRYVKSTQIP